MEVNLEDIDIGEKQEKAKESKVAARATSHSLKNFLKYPHERKPTFQSINNLQAQAGTATDVNEVTYEQALYQVSKPELRFDHEQLLKDDVNSSPKYRKNESK